MKNKALCEEKVHLKKCTSEAIELNVLGGANMAAKLNPVSCTLRPVLSPTEVFHTYLQSEFGLVTCIRSLDRATEHVSL